MVAASTQYLSAANASVLNPATTITIEAWVKFASTNNASYAVASKGNVGGISGPMIFYINPSTGTMNLYVSNGATTTTSTVSWTPTVSTWYHVAAVNDGVADVLFYVNGVQQGATQTGANIFNTTDTAPFFIGAYSTNGTTGNAANFDGQVSLVRYWSIAESASTILANMCTVFGSAQTSMIGEWSLDNVLTDASGNSLTLTNGNTVTFTTDTPATCAVATKTSFSLSTLGVGT